MYQNQSHYADIEQPTRNVTISETIIHRSVPNDRDEHQEQQAVMGWATRNEHKWDGALKMLYAIPNQGLRNNWGDGKGKKAEGLRKGVPDLCLPVARRNFHGLYIELKRTRKPAEFTNAQKEWLLSLGEEGYAVALCYGAAAAIEVLEQYLNG